MKVEWAREYGSEHRAPGPGQQQLDTANGKKKKKKGRQ